MELTKCLLEKVQHFGNQTLKNQLSFMCKIYCCYGYNSDPSSSCFSRKKFANIKDSKKKNLCKQKCDILTENGGFKLYPLPVFDIVWFFSHSEPKFKLFKFRIWRRKNKMWILQCYLFHGSWKPRKHKLPRYGILLHNLWLDFIIFWTI